MTTAKWSELRQDEVLPNLRKHFRTPPDAFRLVPWLTYTGTLTREEVRRAIDHMHDQGIRSFFIFPIYGMEIEYLSDAWFELVRDSVAYSAGKGMTVWIYDDYNWPSGSCAGKLIQEHPEFNIQTMYGELSEPVQPGETVRLPFLDRLISVSTLPPEGQPMRVEVSTEEAEGQQVAVWHNTGPSATRLLTVSTGPRRAPGAGNRTAVKGCLWQKGNGLTTEYIDFLNPDAVDALIAMAYAPYERELKDYWGTTVKGFMTDEPTIGGVHYSEALHRCFHERYGYRIEDHFELLFVPGGDTGRQVRADYQRLQGEMLSKAWSRINVWCEKHGVDLTGHFLGEECPGAEVVSHVTSWPMRKHMAIPGMDVLFDTNYDPTPARKYTTLKHNYSGLALTGKLASAAARYSGSGRAFAEAFGGFPHWGTPSDFTAQTHWTTAQGINFINDNTLAVSWKSFRKRMLWGKHFTMPWWDCYSDVVEHGGRCCLMTAAGKVPARVGLLYPMLTAQALASYRWTAFDGPDRTYLWNCNRVCQQTAEALTRTHRDWEIVWEELLAEASVKDGRLCIKDVAFSVLVLPAACIVDEAVLTKLEAFAAAGGAVIFTGTPPCVELDGMRDLDARVKQLVQGDNVHVIPMDRHDAWHDVRDALSSALDRYDRAPIQLTGAGHERVLTAHRKAGNLDIFHVINMSGNPLDVHAQIVCTAPLTLWHPDDGECYDLPAQKDDDIQRLRLSFAPWEGYFLVAADDETETAGPFPARNMTQPMGTHHGKHVQPAPEPVVFTPVHDPWQIALERANTMPLTSRVLIPSGRRASGEELSADRDSSPDWVTAVRDKLPFGLNPVEHPVFWHQCVFFADHVPADLRVVVDSDAYEAGFLNGKALPPPLPETLWDDANRAFDLGTAVQPGQNVIVFKVQTDPHYDPDVLLRGYEADRVEAVVLQGTFGVRMDTDATVRLVDPPESLLTGDWRLQGLAGYSGCVRYAQDINVKKGPGQTWLDLGEVAVFADTLVNGHSVGRRGWPPYIFRLDEYLEEGTNHIEVRVRNTLGNVLSTAPWVFGTKIGMAPSGILGPVQIYHMPEQG